MVAAVVWAGEPVPRFKYAHDPVPTAPSDVAVASRGAIARTDSNPPRYHPLPMIDGDTWDRNGHVYTAWYSGKSPTPHWAEITFGRPETIGRVTIHWPALRDVWHSSTRYTVEAWSDGTWRTLASQDGPQTAPRSTHTFGPLKTQRIRVRQPVGGGSPNTPDVMWIREIEANAVGEVEPAALPPNLLRGPVRCTKPPFRFSGDCRLRQEGASFIPGGKAIVLVSSRSGTSGKFRIYITCEGKRKSSPSRDIGPIAPGGRARAVFDLPGFDGTVKVVHMWWPSEGEPNESFTIEEVRVVTEAKPPTLWAIRDKALPWRTPAPNATNGPLDAVVTLLFDDQIWRGSLTSDHFKLVSAAGEVPCEIACEPWMRKVILKPRENLSPSTTYLVGMGWGVRDLRGNRIHNRPGELDGYFFSTGGKVRPSPELVKLLGTGGIEVVEWPADLRVGWPGRVVVSVPAGTGKLAVTASSDLRLVDRTPSDPTLGQRKFYFRALAPAGIAGVSPAPPRKGTIELRTPEGARASVSFPILTSAQELATRRVGTLDLPRRWPLGRNVGSRKERSVFYPREKIEAARRKWIEGGRQDERDFPPDQKLYELVPPTWMQRNVYVNEYKGCPVHGTAVHKFRGVGTWRIDPVSHPFQIQCRVGGEWYPTNKIAEDDFTSGDYPDDGFGCWKDGHCYHFLGYYNHYLFTSLGSWYGWTASGVRHFIKTGEQIGARKAMILLYRLAEEYAHLAAKPADRMNGIRGEVHRHDTPTKRRHLRQVSSSAELRILGMFRDHIWTCSCFQSTCLLYDAIFEALREDDRELIDFLHNKNPDINLMADIRRFFEDNFIRVGVQAFMDGSIKGNEGAHQEAMMSAALVLDTPEAGEIVDWVFTGEGQYRYKLANSFFKDGAAFESVSYNSGHVAKLHGVYDLLARLQELYSERYPASKYPVVGAHPKYRAIFRFPIEMCMLDGAVAPSIGDAGTPQHNEILPPRPGGKMAGRRQVYEGLFRSTRDPLFGQVVYGCGDSKVADRDRKRLLYDDSKLNAAVDEVVATHGPRPTFASRLFDGYGLAVLRAGKAKDKRALWMSWSRLRGHPHADMLQIGYCGKQRNVMRCLGYPRLMGHFSRSAWTYNPFTHYKARIWPDGEGFGTSSYRGFESIVRPRHFVGEGPLQLVEAGGAGSESVRDELGRYRRLAAPIHRRTIALIDVSPTDSYVLDLVRLKGGRRHYLTVPGLSMHRAVRTHGLELTPQGKGTLAGEDIGHWEVEKAKTRYRSHYANGLAAYYTVSWADAKGPWSVDWQTKNSDPAQLHLRYSQLPPAGSRVALADGEPFQPKEDDYRLRACFTIREGEEPLTSQFLGAFEYYEGHPLIEEMTRLDVKADRPSVFEPVAARVRAGVQEDTILATDGYAPQRLAGEGLLLDGEYGFVSRRNGTLNAALLLNGTQLRVGDVSIRQPKARYDGKIVAVDYARYTVTVSPAPVVPRALVGEYVLVRSARRQAALRVVAVEPETERNACRLRFEYDPLIGEGVVKSLGDHLVTTTQTFFLAGARYYEDAVLTDESGASVFRLDKVTREGTLYIDRKRHPEAKQSELAKRFHDGSDPGDEANIYIYDYGVRDSVTCFLPARIQRTGDGRYQVRAHQPVDLSLPAGDAEGVGVYCRLDHSPEWRRTESKLAEGRVTCRIPVDSSSDGAVDICVSSGAPKAD